MSNLKEAFGVPYAATSGVVWELGEPSGCVPGVSQTSF